MVRAIREHTRDGDDMVAFVVRVFRGEVEGVRLRDRLEAATWLADRGLGKLTQGVELAGKHSKPLLSLARPYQGECLHGRHGTRDAAGGAHEIERSVHWTIRALIE